MAPQRTSSPPPPRAVRQLQIAGGSARASKRTAERQAQEATEVRRRNRRKHQLPIRRGGGRTNRELGRSFRARAPGLVPGGTVTVSDRGSTT